MDDWTKKYINAIKLHQHSDEDLEVIIDKIYRDGFSDGANEGV